MPRCTRVIGPIEKVLTVESEAIGPDSPKQEITLREEPERRLPFSSFLEYILGLCSDGLDITLKWPGTPSSPSSTFNVVHNDEHKLSERCDDDAHLIIRSGNKSAERVRQCSRVEPLSFIDMPHYSVSASWLGRLILLTQDAGLSAPCLESLDAAMETWVIPATPKTRRDERAITHSISQNASKAYQEALYSSLFCCLDTHTTASFANLRPMFTWPQPTNHTLKHLCRTRPL